MYTYYNMRNLHLVKFKSQRTQRKLFHNLATTDEFDAIMHNLSGETRSIYHYVGHQLAGIGSIANATGMVVAAAAATARRCFLNALPSR